MIGVDVNETFEFVLPFDDQNNPTVWILGHLDPTTAAAIRDALTNYALNQKTGPDGMATMTVNKHQMDIVVARLGIKGWRNFKVKKGGQEVDLEYKTETIGFKGIAPRPVLHSDCIRYLELDWITRIAEAIIGGNFITETESKN